MMPLKENKKNPHSGFVWNAIGCDYCGVMATRYCIVRGSNGRVAQEIHEVRYAQQRAAYDAWEVGRKKGIGEVRDALHDALLELGIIVTPKFLYDHMLKQDEKQKARIEELTNPPAQEAS